MNLHDKICKLCLVKCKKFKSIEGNRKFVLGILLPKIEFAVIQEPVMCKKCEEVLKKCFIFKAACLRSYDYIVALVNSKDGVNLDIKDVYLSKNITNTGVAEDQDVCRFCLNLVENRFAISLDVDGVEEGNVILWKMIEQCLPELDLSIIKNPIICTDCHLSLENCFCFVTNCLTAEEKIKTYCESLNRNSEDKIDLSGLLHSIMRTEEASDVEGDTVDVIKAEKQFCVKIENPNERTVSGEGDVIKLQEMSCNDSKYDNDIGNKDESFMSSDIQKVNNEQQFTPKNTYAGAEEDNLRGTVKIEETFCGENEIKPEDGDFVELDEQKCILDEEIEIKTDEHDFNRIKENIKLQTRVKRTLKKHMLLHMDASEVTIYTCEICSYQSKSKKNHNQHLITHKATSEISMFNCDSCPFQTRWKNSFKSHMLKHMGPSTLTMFKCDSCPFQTRWKNSIRSHMLQHSPSNIPPIVTMFKCESCPYQVRWKDAFKNHLLKHMDPSEVTMYKCDVCPFQTRQKYSLKSHMLKHNDPSKVKLFNCEFCSYQTKWKKSIKSHLVTHKASSEITMFQCDSCPFKTKYKTSLKNHVFRHMDVSKVTMFSCAFCSYQTKYKKNLEQHVVTHKASSDVNIFKCYSCSFQTRRKHSLKNHTLKHRDASKVTMFNCDSCQFQTRWKDGLKKHMLKHIDPA